MNRVEVIQMLKEKNITLGSVESITGGMFASSVTDFPGVSKIFKGGVIAYSNNIKHNIVKVSAQTLKDYGAISGKTAMEMASLGKKLLEVGYCVSFTGNAGPDVFEQKEVGDVYIGLAYGEDVIVEHYNLGGERNKIRQECVSKAWQMLYRVLKDN